MATNRLFDSSGLKLPSVEGIESGCERELKLLMREVDAAFQWKHQDLLREVEILREKCKEKSKGPSMSEVSVLKIENQLLKEKIGHLQRENEELKKQSVLLQNEIGHMKSYVSDKYENYDQNRTLNRRLKVHQEEKCVLDDKYRKLLEKHRILQDNYQKMLNATKLVVEDVDGSGEQNENSYVKDSVATAVKKFCEEENNNIGELMQFLNGQIEGFRPNNKRISS